MIGRVDEPFQVTLHYISCAEVHVALDSLEFIDCESGEFIVSFQTDANDLFL